MTFAFIESERAHYPVRALCEVLGVSRSGFYAWHLARNGASPRAQEDAALAQEIGEVFQEHQCTYGSPRITAELKCAGRSVGRRRVARLMKREGWVARPKRRFVKTTESDHGQAVPENVLRRDFSASAPNEKWVGDITGLAPDSWTPSK